MSSPAFYLTGVLEKIRMVLCLPTEICKASDTYLFRDNMYFGEDFFSFAFSIEICTWLRETFNFFTFIFIFWNLAAFF